jgi:uncharacterized membrane protein HdeD (DUF308 family)
MLGLREDHGLASHGAWLAYRGVVAVLFGLLAFARPGAGTLTLVLLFGAYTFAGGCAALFTAARHGRTRPGQDLLVLDALMGIVLSYFSLIWPARMSVTVVWIFGAWGIAAGVVEIANALRRRRTMTPTLGLAGALSIALGLVMLLRPLAGGLALMWSLGAYALAFGMAMIALGLRVRSSFVAPLFDGALP